MRQRLKIERSMDLLFQEMDEAEIRWGVVMGRLAKDFHRLPFRDDRVKQKVLYATAARLLELEN